MQISQDPIVWLAAFVTISILSFGMIVPFINMCKALIWVLLPGSPL